MGRTYLEVEESDDVSGVVCGGGRLEEEEEHRGELGDQRDQPHEEARGGRHHVVRLRRLGGKKVDSIDLENCPSPKVYRVGQTSLS